jgi:hypothetical protein
MGVPSIARAMVMAWRMKSVSARRPKPPPISSVCTSIASAGRPVMRWPSVMMKVGA